MTIDWSAFTPATALVGGVLIGMAAAILVLMNGRIAGISGIVGGLTRPKSGEVAWRVAFLAGLIGAPLAYVAFTSLPRVTIAASYPGLIVAGLLGGLGKPYRTGCT